MTISFVVNGNNPRRGASKSIVLSWKIFYFRFNNQRAKTILKNP